MLYVPISIISTCASKHWQTTVNLASVIRHLCDVKNSRLGHDILYQVATVISPFRRGFIFTTLRICVVKIKRSRKFPNLQYPNLKVAVPCSYLCSVNDANTSRTIL